MLKLFFFFYDRHSLDFLETICDIVLISEFVIFFSQDLVIHYCLVLNVNKRQLVNQKKRKVLRSKYVKTKTQENGFG